MKLSAAVKDSIKKKLKGSKKISNSYTITEGRYKPATLLKFTRKGKQLLVSISSKKSVHRNGKRVNISKHLGQFNALELVKSPGSRRRSRSRRSRTRRSRRSRTRRSRTRRSRRSYYKSRVRRSKWEDS